MSNAPSELSLQVTQQYWRAVRQLLQTRHRLTMAGAAYPQFGSSTLTTEPF